MAVLAVVAVHVLPDLAPGGFVGVDVFFVISGYLITAITLRRIRTHRFSFADFYARRARRLLPALFAVLVVTGLVGGWLYAAPTRIELGHSIMAATLFVPNLLDYGAVDYFTAPPETRPLLHLWSLGIEEQFYLMAPMLLVALARRRRALVGVTACAVLVSFGTCVWVLGRDPAAAFYLIPFRAWELGIGMLLACLPVDWRAPRGAGVVGLLLVGGAIVGLDEHVPFPGVAALAPCLGSALVLVSAAADPACRGLAWGPLPALGRRSYSLYLWHWPVLAFAMFWTMRAPTPLEALGLVALSLGLTELSYRFVEAPFRRSRGSTARTLVWASGCMVVLVVATSAAVDPEQVSLASSSDDRPLDDQLAGPSLACASLPTQESWTRVCGFGGSPTAPEVVVWGDSHAATLALGFAKAAVASGQTGMVVARNGCPPVLGVDRADLPAMHQCGRHNDAVVAWIRRLRPARVVVVARWPLAFEATRYGDEHRGTPRYVQAGSEARAVDMAAALDRTVALLVEQGTEVVLLGPVPEASTHVSQAVERAQRLGGDLPTGPTLDELAVRTESSLAGLQAASQRAGVRLVEVAPALCGVDPCEVTLAGAPLYDDSNHLNAAGVVRVQGVLEAAVTGE